MGARDADPGTGQFMSIDPWNRPDGMSQVQPYAYTDGDPIGTWDPTGLFCLTGTSGKDTPCRGLGEAAGAAFRHCTFQTGWQNGAACISLIAGGASLGLGGLALAGYGGGIAGGMGTASTWVGVVGTGAQGTVAFDICSREGASRSCLLNAASVGFGVGSAGAGTASGVLANAGSASAVPVARAGLAAGGAGIYFGTPAPITTTRVFKEMGW